MNGMDPQSLDAAVQNTLSGLFPPFDITAPTVLSQLFRVLEARYQGDGLCCLLDFLIPSKRLLEHVRQAACAPYVSCVFLHEGWPLCLHEKVVVHLGPLNPLLLRPGDFYLQAEPCGEQSASLVVKCLSKDLTTVEKIPIPEASCSFLFTKEWLEEINQDLDRPALRTCLVATGNGIVPMPWGKIAAPEFVDVPKIGRSEQPRSSCCPEVFSKLDSQQQENNMLGSSEGGSTTDGSWRPTQSKYPGLIKVEQGSWRRSTLFVMPSLCDIISENLEGEYVNLLGFSEGNQVDFSAKAEMPSAAEQHLRGNTPPGTKKGLGCVNGDGVVALESWSCEKGSDTEEGPCTPCLRRKLSQDPKAHELRCRHRESYVAALKNPVSFSSGLMAAILEEIDVAQQVAPLESAEAMPHEGSPPEHPHKDGKAEESSKPGHWKVLKSPVDGPASGHKFSLLKGHRQPSSSGGGLLAPEKAGKGHEGPRKKNLNVCSPRMGRGKAAVGKGTSPVDVGFSELPTLKITESELENTSSADALLKEFLPPAPDPWGHIQWESLSPELLSSGVVSLPGNTDKLGRPIVQITTSGRVWQGTPGSSQEVARLLLYFCSLSRAQSKDTGWTVLIDARKELPSASLSAALRAIQKALPGWVQCVLLLGEKEAALHLENLPGIQVELLSSLKALGRHVDSSQLTPAQDGQFSYCHKEWVQYFQKFHPFIRDLTKVSELLQRTTRELEKENALKTSKAVEDQVDHHRQLMQEVLRDAQLMNLQREGGATLARLRKEAARLSFCPHVRSSMDGALALYSLVEDEVHSLVTKSNSRLEHLQFLLKVRQLEAEFHKLSVWFDEEGEPELREVGVAEGSRESAEESYRRFKEFFKEATQHKKGGMPSKLQRYPLCVSQNTLLQAACPPARQKGVAVLQQKLSGLTLSDFSGTFRVKFLGNVDYRFDSLRIGTFQLPSSSIATLPGMGLKVSITNAFAALMGHWGVKKWFIKDHGSFDLKVEGTSISVGLTLGTDRTGRLTASTSDCGAHISGVSVHISGRLSWLYNLFRGKIESGLRRTLEGKICGEVTNAVSSRLEPFLQTLPVTAKIDKIAGIDYSLVNPPVTTNNFVDLALKGEFFSMTHRSAAPFPPPALNFPVDHDRMLYFGVSTYFFNTASNVYFKAGAMTFYVTDNMIPKDFELRLNTTTFGHFIPQVEKLYPNLLMTLRVSPSSSPMLSITPESLSLTPVVDVEAFAILPNSSLAPLFVIEATTPVLAQVGVNSTRIVGSLKLGRLQLSLKHSEVGPFSVRPFQCLLFYSASNILLPQVNTWLAKGYPLPLLDGVQPYNLVLRPYKDFLLFGADVQY
ncbi:hypothetical protein JRQ81_014448 [Phrynocephalus forsythii]|uniref:Uncharacterized protein n=1 Tax=Phrynocephalus forsythii TaxID=171643 RepID=A0A9Q0XWQ2_9SAUR|nr:hypothetical protein JRQ81_014448 [Phrynocephalus forsythii]